MLILDETSGRRRGVFQAMYDLIGENVLLEADYKDLTELRDWFNTYLEKPDRFNSSERSHAVPVAICWFKSTATEHVSRMHRLCRILDQYHIPTEMIRSTRPGYIVFQDEHQITALPFADTST